MAFLRVASHLPWSTLCQCPWGVARSEQLEHGWLLAACSSWVWRSYPVQGLYTMRRFIL